MNGNAAAAPVRRRLSAAARALGRDLGWAGGVGLALLIGAGVAYGPLVALRQGEARELKAAVADLRGRQFTRAQSSAVEPPARQLEQLRAWFPPQDELPAALARLTASAARRGVVLAAGEYKLVDEAGATAGAGLVRYEARFPVRGAWRDIHGFVADALNADSRLSLDEIVVKRESGGARDVDTQLRFSLHFRRAARLPD